MYGRGTVTFLILLLMLSAATRLAPLFLFSLALLLADSVARVWRKRALDRLQYKRRLSATRAEFGEKVSLEIEVTNRKLIPLAWLEIEDEVPRELPPAQGKLYASHKRDRLTLVNTFSLRPYEQVVRRYTIPCDHRGEYELGPLALKTSDLFGLFSQDMELDYRTSLVVYPRVLEVSDLGLPAQNPLGELRTNSWIFEDPSRFAGTREYRPEDSLRRIHWSSTARSQQLQVKVYEPTTTHRIMIFLNASTETETFEDRFYDMDAFELAITTAASIARWALEQGYPVGLATNGVNRGRTLKVFVEASRDPSQLQHILEVLGRLNYFTARPFSATLNDESRRLGYSDTLVAVSPGIRHDEAGALAAARRKGHPVVLLLTGRGSEDVHLSGITVRHLGPPTAWREAEDLLPVVAS